MAVKSPGKSSGLTFETLMSVERLESFVLTPDGRSAIAVAGRPQLEENSIERTLLRVDLSTGRSTELTPGAGNHTQPALSPDGSQLAFASSRDKAHGESDGTQLWILPLEGGEARQLTTGYGGASSPVWSPDGKHIAFVRSVIVSDDYQPRKAPTKRPTQAEIYGSAHSKSSARISDHLLFRHWDTWRDRHRNHVCLVNVATGKITDLTPFDCDTPPLSLGSGADIAFAPDGSEIAYVMNPDEVVATSTNNSIFVQRLMGGRPAGTPQCISNSDACDQHPRYTPDGSRILYLAMDVPGYEADRLRIKAYDRKTKKTETHLEAFDRTVGGFHFQSDDRVSFVCPDQGRQSLYTYDLAAKQVRQLSRGLYIGSARPIPNQDPSSDGSFVVTVESTTRPAELAVFEPTESFAPKLQTPEEPKSAAAKGRSWMGSADGAETTRAGLRMLTSHRKAVAKTSMNDAVDFWAPGAGGTPIHGFLIKPARFSEKKSYPLILLIHGGPQAAFADHFHYRWNSQYFASRGACVAFVNPRGSIGYGQKFTDQISGDWGGRCYQDIMLWLDALLAKNKFLDKKRIAAAGASFGGFMVNWIAGNSDRFRALVSHDGIFNAETMAYTTEELWFDIHEHGGAPHEPGKRRGFLKFSPHLNVANFKTPTLVIQGGQDYRCPESEGLGMFTALQLQGVESRYLFFPDEGHWVMQPANSQVWYHEVLDWMMKHLS